MAGHPGYSRKTRLTCRSLRRVSTSTSVCAGVTAVAGHSVTRSRPSAGNASCPGNSQSGASPPSRQQTPSDTRRISSPTRCPSFQRKE